VCSSTITEYGIWLNIAISSVVAAQEGFTGDTVYRVTAALLKHPQRQRNGRRAQAPRLPVESDRVHAVLAAILDARSLRIRDLKNSLKKPHASINALMQYLKRKALVQKTSRELTALFIDEPGARRANRNGTSARCIMLRYGSFIGLLGNRSPSLRQRSHVRIVSGAPGTQVPSVPGLWRANRHQTIGLACGALMARWTHLRVAGPISSFAAEVHPAEHAMARIRIRFCAAVR
jgi:hypothetical protein